MEEGREAHPPAPVTESARDDEPVTEPTREDVPELDRIVVLPIAKDASGGRLKVQIRKLDADEIAILQEENPGGHVQPANERERMVLERRIKAMPAKQKAAIAAKFKSQAEALIGAAAIEPVFYHGRKKPDPRPVDEEGRQLAVAPFAALYDEDRTVLFEQILILADGGQLREKGGAEAAHRLASFPPDGEGASGREGDAEPVSSGEPTA